MGKEIVKNYKMHLIMLFAVIVAELIGAVTIPLGDITIVLSPLIWSMLIAFGIYKIKPLKLLDEKAPKHANAMMGAALALLMAKLGVTSGGALEEIKQAGLALVLQNFGNIGTIFLALPIAILLGLGRESIGMTHALSREANVGLIQDEYSADSKEFRGVMTTYIVGTVFGPILMSVLASLAISFGIISPLAASMGVGAGSASMMTAGLASLIEAYPHLESTMTAYAGLSNLISSIIALPLGIFIGLPITEWLYGKLDQVRNKKKVKGEV